MIIILPSYASFHQTSILPSQLYCCASSTMYPVGVSRAARESRVVWSTLIRLTITYKKASQAVMHQFPKTWFLCAIMLKSSSSSLHSSPGRPLKLLTPPSNANSSVSFMYLHLIIYAYTLATCHLTSFLPRLVRCYNLKGYSFSMNLMTRRICGTP